MELLDARRLTGPNLIWDSPGSILDIRCSQTEADILEPIWLSVIDNILKSVGWQDESTATKRLSGGVSLAFSAPIDVLYAATEINQWAWQCCVAEIDNSVTPDFDEKLAEMQALVDEEQNPVLLALQQAAADHNLMFLWDDDEVSIGLGNGSRTWPFQELPTVESIQWSQYHDLPIGIVTGTNGKTTTVRLIKHILRSAGHDVGISSTDWIGVNDRIIDRGDWSGPGGARQVLRQKDIDVAILETARGGLLRRGLGVNKAQAALITNISEDHLGDYGSQNLQELLDIKWMTSRAVVAEGALILNADDNLLVQKADGYAGKIIWFSMHNDNPVVTSHIENGGTAYIHSKGNLLRMEHDRSNLVCTSHEIPITMGGAARHNIANALAAAALTEHLGITMDDVRNGLCSMSQEDNPGRSNVYNINGVTVLIDFAHNPAAMQALFGMARSLPAKRRLLAFGQAGDRPDDLIEELAQNAWDIGIDAAIVSELATYHRGREYREVFGIIKNKLIGCGLPDTSIQHYDEELDSLQAAIDWAQPGDLVIMLALGGSAPIYEKLMSL